MSEKSKEEEEKGRVINLNLVEAFAFGDLASGTIVAAKVAMGTLSTSNSFYTEASRYVDIAKRQGKFTPADAGKIQHVLDEWHEYNLEWEQSINKAVAEDDPPKINNIDLEMKNKVPTMEQQIQTIFTEIVGYKEVWNEVIELFRIGLSNEEETQVFRKIKHEELLHSFRSWLEKRNFFSNISHGPREAGIDIIAETSQPRVKIGIQIKDNNDIKEKLFSKKLKAQITDSKKHDVKGLIIIFCGDLTDNSVKQKVRGMTSELSQMKNNIIVIPPEKALTILRDGFFS